jgi:hypothetical protein
MTPICEPGFCLHNSARFELSSRPGTSIGSILRVLSSRMVKTHIYYYPGLLALGFTLFEK